MIKKQYELTN